MLYSFFGTDVVGVREKAHAFMHGREEQGVSSVRITPENWSTSGVEDAAGSLSLFGGEQLYIVDTPSGDKEMLEYIFENLDMLAESPNTFVLIEEGLLAAPKKKLQKYSAEAVEVTAGKVERFNVFALTDALSRRDKKSLWILLQQAKQNGLSEEEIIGTLFWQLKTMRLVAHSRSAEEAELKPFVYSKTKSANAKFKEEEVDLVTRELVRVYHDGHLGKRDIAISLEKWVLAL
ncbi:hypothetical protein GW943_02925 [Candidatus Parcubacteria bacterium]|uniref:DNA polymerase III delta N-terminal domain-containing protein n=1 Tax=Candidatus Kaiserbacteria bacterium CG10_big_fil_rev_8_21_14_0_10_47_16 TaxID=1974608 RepID=A0A2H0UE49_9BACT|nr:hypothetical protein [Candidatus Parcubacteria bacterium]PIR84630.1 MAG: hypothetical protein COU16_03590 [Candidatus Kaiserbacteria bacterium CG10_big_fil_rev_8_21_14_0_10_47_16]